jgi:hypothetical protein
MLTEVMGKRSSTQVHFILKLTLVTVLLSFSMFTYYVFASGTTGNYSINKIQSGLVTSDKLNNQHDFFSWFEGNLVDWNYGGDAPERGAPYVVLNDAQGLHIGVQASASGHWAGYYAASPITNAMLFHAVIATPVRTVPSNPSQYYENAMAIKTYEQFINYVDCGSLTNNGTTVWGVGSVTGNASDGTHFHTLWTDPNPDQPLTRDCTIITNGNNYLRVYLDGKNVYTSNSLNLQMTEPFNAYLAPESSYASQLLKGTYKDYYATTDENVRVVNNPDNVTTVKLVDSSGVVLASANVNSGTATISIGQYHFPLAAYIILYDRTGTQLTSTSSPMKIFGGDVYSVNPMHQFFSFGFGIPFKF